MDEAETEDDVMHYIKYSFIFFPPLSLSLSLTLSSLSPISLSLCVCVCVCVWPL